MGEIAGERGESLEGGALNRSAVLRLYHALPPVGRSVVASLRGFQLRSWRYGPDAESRVAEALERDRWNPSRWRAWQEERLAFVLRRAATRVPYYRRQWEERRRRGDRASVERLENWPILDKERVRESPQSFVADDCDVRRMYHEHTSGTTGKPLNLWWSRDTVRAWFSIFEARIRRWNGVTRHDRWGILGGQLVVPVERRRPPFWVWNTGLHQLYMSSYHLSPNNVAAYLAAMRRYGVGYAIGYPSALSALAQGVLEQGLSPLPLKVAISNAEPLTDSQRRAVEQAFLCPVRDTYGMAEIVAAGSECEAGSLHQWPEVGVTEVLRDDSNDRVADHESGRLICTGLLNADMPLVRYAVGDRGRIGSGGRPCPCGRELPSFDSIEGRADDVVFTPDGRRVGRLDPVFKADLRIREAQIVQENLTSVRVNVVPAPGFGPRDEREIVRGLRQRLGDSMGITVESVDSIPRTEAGKLRAVISRVGHVSGSAAEPSRVNPEERVS